MDFTNTVIEMVYKYAREHLDKTDGEPDFSVFVVWFCHILGNKKWLLSTTLLDGMYYEVTFNSAKNEFYLDAYKKFENRRIPKQDENKDADDNKEKMLREEH